MIYRDKHTKKLQSKQLDKFHSDEKKSGRAIRREKERALDEFSSKVQKLFDWWDCVSQYEQWNIYGDWIHHKVKLRLSGNEPNLEAYINSMKDKIKFDRALYREKKLRKLGI